MTAIQCQTLGPVGVTVRGAPAPPELLWRKHLALLISLARAPHRSRTRQQLTGLLWADKPEAAARHSLNEALRVIRRCGGDDSVETGGERVTLSAQAVWLDVDEFERLAKAGDLAGASRLVLGEFLEGFSVPGESGFEDWVAAERRGWGAQTVAVLTAHSQQLARSGRLDEAVELANRGLQIIPVADGPMESLMRALALQGERARALERYEQYRALLQERFETRPSNSLTLLVERIRQEPARPARPVTTEASPQTGLRRLPLVAREVELRELLDRWVETAAHAVPHAGFILGDIGTGKTRLGEEMAARVRLEGGVVASVRAVQADRPVPDSGILGLLSDPMVLAARGLSSSAPAAIATLSRSIPAWNERFPQRRDQSGQTAVPLRLALSEVLRGINQEQPVLLWIDDAQFLDPESLLDLEALLRDGSGLALMVLFGAAPQPERPELDSLRAKVGRDIAGVAVTLGPLDSSAVRALAAYALPSYSSSELERVSRRVALDSAGLPLLVVEVLAAVASGLELAAERGAWPEPLRTLSQTLPSELPDSITAAIRIEFRRLTPPAQKVLAACSILSDRVAPGNLAQVLELPVSQVATALDELEWARWLVAEPRGYGFLARVIRDVIARDMLTPGQRRRLLDRASSLVFAGT